MTDRFIDHDGPPVDSLRIALDSLERPWSTRRVSFSLSQAPWAHDIVFAYSP